MLFFSGGLGNEVKVTKINSNINKLVPMTNPCKFGGNPLTDLRDGEQKAVTLKMKPNHNDKIHASKVQSLSQEPLCIQDCDLEHEAKVTKT